MKHKNIKNTIIFTFFILFSLTVNAQFLDAGIMIGMGGYQGDLSPKTVTDNIKRTREAIGVHVRYNITSRIGVKLSGNYTRLSADDIDVKGGRGRYLNFESKLYELALISEVNIFRFSPSDHSYMLTPYFYGGLALFNYNPTTILDGKQVNLHDYHTEGQGFPDHPKQYELTQMSIPLGFGVKYLINESLTLGFELGFRITFTDYLDDVSSFIPDPKTLEDAYGIDAVKLSQPTLDFNEELPVYEPFTVVRGNPNNKDLYFISGISLSYIFSTNGFSRSRRKQSLGCPTF